MRSEIASRLVKGIQERRQSQGNSIARSGWHPRFTSAARHRCRAPCRLRNCSIVIPTFRRNVRAALSSRVNPASKMSSKQCRRVRRSRRFNRAIRVRTIHADSGSPPSRRNTLRSVSGATWSPLATSRIVRMRRMFFRMCCLTYDACGMDIVPPFLPRTCSVGFLLLPHDRRRNCCLKGGKVRKIPAQCQFHCFSMPHCVSFSS